MGSTITSGTGAYSITYRTDKDWDWCCWGAKNPDPQIEVSSEFTASMRQPAAASQAAAGGDGQEAPRASQVRPLLPAPGQPEDSSLHPPRSGACCIDALVKLAHLPSADLDGQRPVAVHWRACLRRDLGQDFQLCHHAPKDQRDGVLGWHQREGGGRNCQGTCKPRCGGGHSGWMDYGTGTRYLRDPLQRPVCFSFVHVPATSMLSFLHHLVPRSVSRLSKLPAP